MLRNGILLMLVPWISARAAEPMVLNRDGAWCWFQDERALVYDGKLRVASIGRTGDVQVTTWDFKTGKIGIATLHPKFQVDDHNAPGMLMRHHGRLMAFYTEHGGPKASNPMLWRVRLKGEYGWDKTWVASYSNDFAGYIPSARVLREGGYEGGGAMRGQDHPGPYTEAVEEIMIRKARELIRRTGE